MKIRDVTVIALCMVTLGLVALWTHGTVSASPPAVRTVVLNYTLQQGTRCTSAQAGGGGWCWIKQFPVPAQPTAVMYAWNVGGNAWLYSGAGSGLTLYNHSNWAVYGVHLEIMWQSGKLILMRHAGDESTFSLPLRITLLYQ